MEELAEFLRKRESEGLLRVLKPISSRSKEAVWLSGKEFIDFSSNDYLGLSQHPELIEAAKKALDKFGTASCASRLMSGDLSLHHELEERVALFKGKEAALVFNSGYQANVGIISALYGKGDCIFSDRLIHASIIDGIVLSGARFFRFRHNDAAHLELLLKKERAKFKKALIITETVFSMDGDRAPLKDLAALKDKYSCLIMVDEAHATGIFGDKGRGVVELERLEERIDLIMGTFSKALAGYGAYLAGSKLIINFLINTCRSFIYSTALPPSVIACNLKSLELIEDEPFRRSALLDNAGFFRNALRNKGFSILGNSQIIPVMIGKNNMTLEYAERLKNKGYWVTPVRYPTVPKDEARLRLSLTYNHTKEILEEFIDEIGEIKI